MKRYLVKALLGAVLLLGVSAAQPARAQGIPVYDNTSFLELVQQFEQGAQQLTQLQQQLTAQLDMIRSLPSTIMPGLGQLVSSTQQLMSQIQDIQNMGSNLQGQLNSVFPTSFSGSSPQSILNTLASITSYNRQAISTAMGIQSQIAKNDPQIESNVGSAVSAGQAAAGPTAAIQASNQILASMSQQLAQQDDLLITAQRTMQQQALQQQSDQAAADAFNSQDTLGANGQGWTGGY